MSTETANGNGVPRSASFLDVRSTVEADVPPSKRAKTAAVVNLLEGRKAVQESENEIAEVVIVCEPEQASLMMGGLHPRGSLYERPVNIDVAKQQHAEFRNVLRAHGVKVLTVREILAHNVDTNMSARVICQMGTSQLIDTVMINPTVTLQPSYRDTGFTASYTFEPLSNLVYTRDQQVTTCKGIVMGRLRSAQRQREVQVMRFCFNKLGMAVAGEIKEPGYLEGGDFFPMSRDLAMAGIGLRSNLEACKQLMDDDLLGTRRFAVVRDDFDQHQDRMHLDCVFSVLSDTCCIMLADIMGDKSPTRRLVDEYTRDPETGKYKMTREGVEFSAFIAGEGYAIIPISNEHQLQYACNVLNLGDSRIVSVHAPSARQIVRDPRFKGDVQVIDFSSITSMYGSVHCASQVVKRIPRK
ncbi:hypothetical protein CHLRE_08g360350v5 [Chlamydomonas reinhardtii]|uniref:Arginine deiminase n=1 Tax=Chlamydomonas reinhardtii TaxID=3055 RepID=A0A2K3DGF0_CHLRE|nr:uncharacterized protein CHLRE_08g360350v5 [Chlamydomonas reinhardtii]XP_042921803.1 uncharacterized protein CHLRE_08g360350v5 [Chlamydomonas reinhardtii]PNW79619.1 hypothetical protein CHLRE_08g360350v5 [Chlamydomonas reinhardtii]PNW79620.1 hypothetical protein CHLRE_08g360350v5 [Chlamydomonas reinhardtii]